jgi:hypothetical protein
MSQSRSSGVDDVQPTEELGRPVRLEPTGLKAGAVLGSRFQIEAAIGEGGSGQVFRAWDRVLGEPVALKILRPDRAQEKSWIKRLAREVKVARAIRHPNVCRVFDLGNVDHYWFVSMELASGGTLRDALRAGQERPLSQVLTDARAVCAGLAAIHTVGIIHRDVTPQNVLRMADGRLVLSDFGLAVEGGDTTVHGGTPSYMAPETAMGQRPDQRSDVWQLGFVLHELIFGRRPKWHPSSKGIVFQDPIGPGAVGLPRELSKLCRACLAANPADRPANAMEVSARLVALEVAPSEGAFGRLVGRRPGMLICGAAVVSALAWLAVERRFYRSAGMIGQGPALSAVDRQTLRSMAERLKAQGRLDDARSLNRLAGSDRIP